MSSEAKKTVLGDKQKKFLFLLVLIAFLTTLSALHGSETVFHVEATTEIVRIDSLSRSSSNLIFYNAVIIEEKLDELEKIDENFNGEFEPAEGLTITFERVSRGPLIISLIKQDPSTTKKVKVGKLIDFETGKATSLYSGSIIHVNKFDSLLAQGQSYVFPFTGKVSLGKKIGYGITGENIAILRSGSAVLSSKSIITGDRYRARELNLQSGDYIRFDGNSYAYGFVNLDESPAMRTSFRVLSPKAIVRKSGPEDLEAGYALSTSLYSRISNDQYYQTATSLGALILFLIGVARFIFELLKMKNSAVQK